MQPFAILIGSQAIIALTTVIVFLFLLIIFRFHINKYVYYVFIIVTLIFLLNFFLYDGRTIILLTFAEFAIKSFSLFVIGSFSFATDYLKKYFYIFAILNFISLLIIVVLGYIETFSYMRFGYAMLPTLLFSIYALRDNSKKLFWSIIMISSFTMILIFGSRGPLLGLIIFILIILFADSKLKMMKKMLFTIGILASYVYFISLNGFSKILDFIYFNLNFQTYSISKLRLMFEEGVAESSSGRDYLYENFINQIMIKPVLGNGIGITQELWDFSPHNLFLQVLIEFGFVGMAVFLIISLTIVYLLIKIRSADNDLFLILSIIFSVSFSRLLVSSDLWLRQELWLFISMSINSFFILKLRSSNRKASINFKKV